MAVLYGPLFPQRRWCHEVLFRFFAMRRNTTVRRRGCHLIECRPIYKGLPRSSLRVFGAIRARGVPHGSPTPLSSRRRSALAAARSRSGRVLKVARSFGLCVAR